MFGVTINNDDAIIQSLESQVTLRYCTTFKDESISVVGTPIMTFEQIIYWLFVAGYQKALLYERYRQKERAAEVEPFHPRQLPRPH